MLVALYKYRNNREPKYHITVAQELIYKFIEYLNEIILRKKNASFAEY